MSIKEYVAETIKHLNEADLQQVAEYVSFLRFRQRSLMTTHLDATQIAKLYAGFADEDMELAEQGMEEYAAKLQTEDS